jgi:hypothetical protein
MSLVPLREPPGSRCFVCATANPAGLRIPFAYDEATGAVQAEVTFGDLHGGAPTYVHIGLTLAVLNEAMAWSVVAGTSRFAVTTETGAAFSRPVRIGPRYLFRGHVESVDGTLVRTSATVSDADGVACAEASATFQMLSPRVAERLRARVTGGRSRPDQSRR